MINRIADKIAGNYNEKELKKIQPIVRSINDIYEHEYTEFDQAAVQTKTAEFKSRVQSGESLDDILPEAYALVKRACALMVGNEYDVKGTLQTWNMIPYDVQLVGGIVLHRDTIAEMKTGEGKTLVAALPLYLNALTGQGAHLVTVNDYLASRDAQWIGYLYQFLGLTIGSVTKSTPQGAPRREQYACDITYVENSELGFDYLRDNLAKSMSERVLLWRPLSFAIVDEIDSILIDEARTPLIISQPAEASTDKYGYYAKIIRNLTPAAGRKKISKGFLHDLLNDAKDESDSEPHGDYYIDEKTKNATLTSEGIAKLEKILGVENLYRDIGFDEIHHIENAIKAQSVYRRDQEYIVTDGQVVIIDTNTGRAMPGRRFSQGLHQAIEAKEGVTIQRESKTIATITYQNFFKQYKKLAGMTGTATTEGEEFESIYGLGVLAIETNRPILRVDYGDKVFYSQKAKRQSVAETVKFAHAMGQPILVGTSSIQTSEFVSQMLTQSAIKHSVLNAKYHEQEANIVAGAGQYGSVVVATNMAGRGTDIKLPTDLNERIATNYAKRAEQQINKGNAVSLVVYSRTEAELTIDALAKHFGLSVEEVIEAERDHAMTHNEIEYTFTFNTKKKKPEHAYLEIVLKPQGAEGDLIEQNLHYGLMILATEKHDSRRIDNQLRGRAGRQGDCGVSMFFVALDDEIMRKVGGEKIQSMAAMLMSKDELEKMELTNSQFTSSIIRAQKQMEARHFSSRKHLFDYDTVVDKQRQKMYDRRNLLLQALNDVEKQGDQAAMIHITESPVVQDIVGLIPEVVSRFVIEQEQLNVTDADLHAIITKEFGVSFDILPSSSNELIQRITESLQKKLNTDQDIPVLIINKIITTNNLNVIDHYRIDHIDIMQHVRDKVGLMSYARLDPLVQYKKEAYELFQQLQANINRDIVSQAAQIDRANISDQIFTKQEESRQSNMVLDSLRSAAASSPEQATVATPHIQMQSDEDGIEVIQLDNTMTTPTTTQSLKSSKLRPNDKITIRYTDGKVEYDVKYKKVKNLIEKGEVEIIG